MTMLANVDGGRALSLADYEARIHLYREQIGTGYIGIGRTLNEAKEAKVVPHGQWEDWVTRTTGLTPRQAQRCMQAATEIRDGSAMARLEMSKALMLLSSGLDEETREEIAEKAVEEGTTVKALRDELKKAKLQIIQETGAAMEIRDALRKAEEDRSALENQLQETMRGYQDRLASAETEAYRKGEQNAAGAAAKDLAAKDAEIRQLRADLESNRQQRQSLKDQLNDAQDWGSKKVLGIQNELNKQRQYAEDMKRNQEDLLAAAEEAEKRAADAEAELAALKACAPDAKEPAWKTIRTATDRFMLDCEMLPIHDPSGILKGEKQIEISLGRVEAWLNCMREVLAGCIRAEGAVR